MSQCKKIFLEIKHIKDWEGCARSTADIHYTDYCKAFDKKEDEPLTILEYAAIKNIEPAELFLRLDINITLFNADQLELCMLKIRRRLEAVKKKQSPVSTTQKIPDGIKTQAEMKNGNGK